MSKVLFEYGKDAKMPRCLGGNGMGVDVTIDGLYIRIMNSNT